MGASGSGKTTLLTALAGQLPATRGMELHGVIAVNGKPHSASSHRQAFVAQEDIFYSQLTVRCVHSRKKVEGHHVLALHI
jgi:ABC-type multidrug transport system ATPase subunit